MKDRNKQKITTSAIKSLFQKEINLRINFFFGKISMKLQN